MRCIVTERQWGSKSPAVRRDDIGHLRASSRLLERGVIAHNMLRQATLEVVGLEAFGSSVFVRSKDWDAEANNPPYLFNRHSDMVAVAQNRRVILYEFERGGEHLRRLVLSLLQLRTDCDVVTKERSSGSVSVRGEFIHFYEHFEFFDIGLPLVRIDYLFTRSGQRIGAWSKGPGIGRLCTDSALHEARNVDLSPHWIIGDRLVDFRRNPDTSVFIHTDVHTLCQPGLLPSAGQGQVRSEPQTSVTESRLYIPDEHFPITFVGRSLHPYSTTTSDLNAAWLYFRMSDDKAGEAAISKLTFDGSRPVIAGWRIPSHHELIGTGIIKNWFPDLSAATEDYYDHEPGEDDWEHLGCRRLLSWDNEIVLIYESINHSKRIGVNHAVFAVVSSEQVTPIKCIDEDLHFLESSEFSESYVYTPMRSSNGEDAIRVTNVHTDGHFQFIPRVPVSDRAG